MSYTTAALGADLLDKYNRDLPMMIGNHELFEHSGDGGFALDWRLGAVGTWIAGVSGKDSDFPVRLSHDGLFDDLTKPDAVQNAWTFLIDFGSENGRFDSIILGGHNFHLTSVNLLKIEVADDSGFTVNLKTLVNLAGPFNADRFALLDLGPSGPLLYSKVRYMRVIIGMSAPGIPGFSELMIGLRSQLSNGVLLPENDLNEETNRGDFETRSGRVRMYTFFKGRANRSIGIRTDVQEDIDVINLWWRYIQESTRPFVWINHPKTAPEDALWGNTPPQKNFPLISLHRDITIRFKEFPFFRSQEA